MQLRSRTVEHVFKQCNERNLPFPDHVVLQCDNTVAQAKNKETMAFFATLAMLRIFRSATLNFLMVGHTHEDVDQLFGCIAALLRIM